MSNKLMSLFNEKMKKSKGNIREAEADYMYSTGFLELDYVNGTIIHVTPKDQPETQYQSVGLVDGSSNTFIGRSGCGKSTYVIQVIGNMLRENPGSVAYIDDIERSLPDFRKQFLLGLPEDELKERVHFRDTGITTENVYEQVKTIRDVKVENRSELEYDTGKLDIYGNKIYKMIPTFYLIDSFAMLMPEDVQDKDLNETGNMTGAQTAKKNTELVKKMGQMLKEANIIMFVINHILQDISTGFMPNAAQISGLKQGERLSGGRTSLYLANNMFRLDDAGTLKDSEGFGIRGTIVNIKAVKSRTNANNIPVPFIFNKTTGAFDNILSLFYFLKSNGALGGAGRSMYLENCPDIRFSQKEFKDKLLESTELQKAFAELCHEYLSKLLSDTRAQDVNTELDINKMILGL